MEGWFRWPFSNWVSFRFRAVGRCIWKKGNETNNNLAAEDASWEIFHERGSIRKENAKKNFVKVRVEAVFFWGGEGVISWFLGFGNSSGSMRRFWCEEVEKHVASEGLYRGPTSFLIWVEAIPVVFTPLKISSSQLAREKYFPFWDGPFQGPTVKLRGSNVILPCHSGFHACLRCCILCGFQWLSITALQWCHAWKVVRSIQTRQGEGEKSVAVQVLCHQGWLFWSYWCLSYSASLCQLKIHAFSMIPLFMTYIFFSRFLGHHLFTYSDLFESCCRLVNLFSLQGGHLLVIIGVTTLYMAEKWVPGVISPRNKCPPCMIMSSHQLHQPTEPPGRLPVDLTPKAEELLVSVRQDAEAAIPCALPIL